MDLAEQLRTLEESKREPLNEQELGELRDGLDHQKKMTVGYPFRLEIVEKLHEHRNEPAVRKLIADEQEILKKMLQGLQFEKDFGYLPDEKKRENQALEYLRELAGKD